MEAPVDVEERLLTAEEFYDLFAGQDFELVRGRVVDARSGLPLSGWYRQTAQALGIPVAGETMTGPTHGMLESRLAGLLGSYLEMQPVGKVLTNTGFVLGREPDVTRAPDVAFVSSEKIAPDLAVEIVSPEDRAEAVYDKVQEYLTAGVQLVWVVYPRQRQVQTFRAGSSERLVSECGVLSGDNVITGFELPLERLWSVLD